MNHLLYERSDLCSHVHGDDIPAVVALSLSLLTAKAVGKDRWDFAFSGAELLRLGLNPATLQRLVRRGFVKRRDPGEATAAGMGNRLRVEPVARDRFIATDAAVAVATHTVDSIRAIIACCARRVLDRGARARSAQTPRWDDVRRELWYGRILVKRFRRSAPNQELILRAFEQCGRPHRIDDPLCHSDVVDSVEGLHDAIKSLNRSRSKRRVLRFGGDGTGRGVCWHLETARAARRTVGKRRTNGALRRTTA